MICIESYQSSLTDQCRVSLADCWNFKFMKVLFPSYTPLGDQLPVTMTLLLCVPCLSWPAYPARGLVNTVTNEMTSPTWRLPSNIQHPLEKCWDVSDMSRKLNFNFSKSLAGHWKNFLSSSYQGMGSRVPSQASCLRYFI